MALRGDKQFQKRIFYFNYPRDVPENIFTRVTRAEDTIAVIERFVHCENIAKYLLQEGFLSQYNFTRLTTLSVDQSQANHLIEILMKSGEQGRALERFYYCLMTSYQKDGIHSHKEFADHLRYCVAKILHLSPLIPTRSCDVPLDAANICTQHMIMKLEGVPLSEETAQDFAVNLGASKPSNYVSLTTIAQVCQEVQKEKFIPPQELIKAMVVTKGLGRYASSLAYPIYSIELESFLFGLSQRRRWIRIAEYVGFEREEIDTWDKGTQQGALTFFEKWRLPDCGPLNDEMISMLATNTDLHYSIHQPAAGTGLDSQLKGGADPKGGAESPEAGFTKKVSKSLQDDGDIIFDPNLGETDWKLIRACENSETDEILSLLVSKVANPNIWSPEGVQPIHIVAENGCIKGTEVLLNKGASVNSKRKKDGKTPLLIAATKKNTELAKVLLKFNADVNIKDKSGAGCLHDKDVLENDALVSLICRVQGADVDLPTDSGSLSPLVIACMINSEKAIRSVDTLIGYNANVNGIKGGDVTPLGVAATEGNTNLVERLLELSAGIDIQDKKGRTPLLRACTFNKFEVAKLLLESGANPNIFDDDGDTPVMAAVIENNEALLDLLLKYKPNVDIPRKLYKDDGSGKLLDCVTPVCFAASSGRHTSMVKKLVEANADINYVSQMYPYPPLIHAIYGNSEETFKYLMNQPALDSSFEKMSLAVSVAIKFHREEMTKELIRNLGGYKSLMECCEGKEEHSFLQESLKMLTPEMQQRCEPPTKRHVAQQLFQQSRETLAQQAIQATDIALSVCDELVEIVMSMISDCFQPEEVLDLAQQANNSQAIEFFNYFFNKDDFAESETGLLFKMFTGHENIKDIEDEDISSIMLKKIQSPAMFIFGNEDLFTGVKFKSKLLSIGKKDFVDRLQTSIFQFISVTDNEMNTSIVSGKFSMMNMFGGRFVSELIKAGLIMEDQGQKAFTDEPFTGDPYLVGQPPSSSKAQHQRPENVYCANNLDVVTEPPSLSATCKCDELEKRVKLLEDKVKEHQELIDKLLCYHI